MDQLAPAARILIVEDETVLAATLCDWLTDAGFEVAGIAAEGPEAVRLARQHRPDLAVVDLTLAGGTDGLATADELARRAGTPTLFLTAHPQRVPDPSPGLATLAKPVTAGELVDAIRTVLALARDEPAAPVASSRLDLHEAAAAIPREPVVPAEGESRFRAVFETAPHGMVTFDLDLVVIDANASLALMLGEEPRALAGRALASLDCVDVGVLEAAHACVAGCADVILEREVEVHEPEGAGRHYRVAGTLVRGRGDEPRYATLHVLDLTAQRRAEAELERLAWYDRLTALPNRAFFERRLDELRRRAARDDVPFALLLLDLDGFKAVNDRHGHAAGDALLELAGRRLGECLRTVDMVARLGGDEFAILLADAGIEDGVAVAELVSDALRRPFDLGDVEVRVAASLGVVSSADGDMSGDAMLRRADLALYRAKREGPGGARRG